MTRCKAKIRFGDDYGDNCSTFHCQLEEGHTDEHIEKGNMGDEERQIPYILSWLGDMGDEDDYPEDSQLDRVKEGLCPEKDCNHPDGACLHPLTYCKETCPHYTGEK